VRETSGVGRKVALGRVGLRAWGRVLRVAARHRQQLGAREPLVTGVLVAILQRVVGGVLLRGAEPRRLVPRGGGGGAGWWSAVRRGSGRTAPLPR
jgi:hypothetical protein